MSLNTPVIRTSVGSSLSEIPAPPSTPVQESAPPSESSPVSSPKLNNLPGSSRQHDLLSQWWNTTSTRNSELDIPKKERYSQRTSLYEGMPIGIKIDKKRESFHYDQLKEANKERPLAEQKANLDLFRLATVKAAEEARAAFLDKKPKKRKIVKRYQILKRHQRKKGNRPLKAKSSAIWQLAAYPFVAGMKPIKQRAKIIKQDENAKGNNPLLTNTIIVGKFVLYPFASGIKSARWKFKEIKRKERNKGNGPLLTNAAAVGKFVGYPVSAGVKRAQQRIQKIMPTATT